MKKILKKPPKRKNKSTSKASKKLEINIPFVEALTAAFTPKRK